MKKSVIDAAAEAAFVLPAGVPGREALVLSARRLRAGEPTTLSAAELLAAASRARRNFFAAQKAAKATRPKRARRRK